MVKFAVGLGAVLLLIFAACLGVGWIMAKGVEAETRYPH